MSAPSASSELRECEAAVRHDPESAVAVGRALGFVRELGLYRAAGFKTWEVYVEDALGVPLPLADAAIGAREAWLEDGRNADAAARAWLLDIMRYLGADAPTAQVQEARDHAKSPRQPAPRCPEELARACAALQTIIENGDDEVDAEGFDYSGGDPVEQEGMF